MPVPNHAPSPPAVTIVTNVTRSTGTAVEKERSLQHRRNGMPHIERAGNLLVVNHPAEPKNRGRGRERSDPERVEKVRDEAECEQSAHVESASARLEVQGLHRESSRILTRRFRDCTARSGLRLAFATSPWGA